MLRKYSKQNDSHMLTARKLMGFTLITFIVLSLISTAVYMITGYITLPAAAFFESVSALTTTGTSVFFYSEYLPVGMKIFRAASQWIGGACTLVFIACIIDSTFSYAAERSTVYHFGKRFRKMIFRLLLTYVILTVAETILLIISKCAFTDALCISLSTVSTGGFAPGAVLNTGLSKTVVLLFMVLTCVNYTLYYHAFKGHFDKFEKNSELNAFVGILVGGCVLVVASLALSGKYSIAQAIEYGTFQTVSSLSTTGYLIVDTAAMPAFTKAVLTILSFIGGSSCSLSSGIKIIRLVVILKILSRSFTVRIHPKAVITAKINAKGLPRYVSASMSTFFMMYFAFYIIGAFIISFEAPDLITCFTCSAAFLNNTGLVYSGGMTYGALSPVMHILLSLLMLAGRTELYAFMIPLTKSDSK